VAVIAWGPWQMQHITRRHGVSAADFDAAWHDPERVDLAEEFHEGHGPYWVSLGAAAVGKPLKMVWRWQDSGETVWPVTAFFVSRRRSPRR
jgi:hypothetical protein